MPHDFRGPAFPHVPSHRELLSHVRAIADDHAARFAHLDETLKTLTAKATIQTKHTAMILAVTRDTLNRLCKLIEAQKENTPCPTIKS